MPMEVREKDKWLNIKKLILLRWKNGRFVLRLLIFFGFCLIVELLSLKSLWMSGGHSVNDWVILDNYGGFGNFAIIIFMAGLLFNTGSVLNEDSVGMYPGTIKTRYISRILSDVLLLLLFVVEMGILNLLQTAGYVWMIKITGNFEGIRTPENLGLAMILTFLCVLAIYSVMVFIQTLYERVGAVKFWIGAGIVFACVVLEAKMSFGIFKTFLRAIDHFIWQKGELSTRIALVSGMVFLVFMVLSFGLLCGIHSWKKENTYGGKFVIRFLVLFISYMIMAIGITDYTYYSWGYMGGTLEQLIEDGKYLVEDTVQECGIDQRVSEKLNQSMSDLETDLSIQWVSLEQAKKVGIVDEKVSLGSQQICIRTVVNNLEVQGTSLTKGFLNAELTLENGAYQIKRPLKVMLNNKYLGLFTNLFLSDEERNNLEMLRDDSLEDFLGYFIIYNEQDIPEDQVPMSMSAGMALSAFDWELEE